MDVVKTNIEQIGGKVSIHTEAGVGTTLRMRIPLTLAIMTALLVRSGANYYAIPQANLLELVRLDVDGAGGQVEMICDAAVHRLRGELLPLVWLDTELTQDRQPTNLPRQSTAPTIVVLQADDRRFGLVVDSVVDTQEIVVKPLGRHVRAIPIFAGATITGNGRVVLILDVPGVAMRAHVLSARDCSAVTTAAPAEEAPVSKESLLLFAGPDAARMAVPLSQIIRLEEFPRAALERLGDRDVVQYYGDILPLVDIASLLSGSSDRCALSEDVAILPTLVVNRSGRKVGVVVERLLDTIEETFEDLGALTRDGMARSRVIDGLVTEVLDLNVL
jgi:two-component system chemotaxis sensor kinase CheA